MNLDGVRVVRGAAVSELLTPEWDNLVMGQPHSTIFQTAGWYRGWIETVAEAEQAQPLVIISRHAGQMSGAIPLQVSSTDGSPCALRPLTWPWADYHEALCHPADRGRTSAELASGLARTIDETGLPLLLEDAVSGGLWEEIAKRLGAKIHASSLIASIDLKDHSRIDQILERREYCVKQRKLERMGKVTCLHHRCVERIRPRMKDFIAMHRNQWQERPDAVAPFDGSVIDSAFHQMIENLAPPGNLELTELLLDERPLAMYFGFLFRRHYYGYRTTFDPAFFRCSPGHLMFRHMIRSFRDGGLDEFDLMRGGYAYKKDYVPEFRANLKISYEPNPE